MKVTLINYTFGAAELLLFTKSTRLTLSPALMETIEKLTDEEKLDQLRYMARTIPSSWEFVDYTFLVEGVSRAYTHQQVRTRSASYAQQTMRVLPMGAYEYIYTDANLASPEAMKVLKQVNEQIRAAYNKLIGLGQAVEDARGILPTNISTNIVCKFNLRAFCDVAASRSGGRTQSEYRKVVNGMIDEVLKVHPWAEEFIFQHGRNYFDDLEEFAEHLRGRGPFGSEDRAHLLKIVDQMRKERQ